MYQDYLDAHDELVAGTAPSNIPTLAEFSARMDDDTIFFVQSLGLELRGRTAIEQFMVDARQGAGVREVPDRIVEHGDLVVAFNTATMTDGESDTVVPVVAVFKFDGDRVTGCWGFA